MDYTLETNFNPEPEPRQTSLKLNIKSDFSIIIERKCIFNHICNNMSPSWLN